MAGDAKESFAPEVGFETAIDKNLSAADFREAGLVHRARDSGDIAFGALLLFELDVPNAAFDRETQGVRGPAIGGVDVLSVFILFEAMDINRTETSVDRGRDSNIFRQLDDGFTNSTLDDGLEVFAALAGEVHVGLARADVEFQTREINLREVQIAASCANVNLEFEWNLIAHFQVPDIVGVHHDLASALLANAQCADAV
jgi:hypothetical protein